MKRKLRKPPDPSAISNCTVCGDSSNILYLVGACHPQAPLRLVYRVTGQGQGILSVSCYIPECQRLVGTFEVSTVLSPPLQEEAADAPLQGEIPLQSPNCVLCSDNDSRHFHTTPVDDLKRFTAPLRLEHHRSNSGPSTLHIFCCRQGCGRLFAILAINTGPKN